MFDVSRITCLVVDDNAHMRALIREILRGAGNIDVVEAAEAAEAFDRLRTTPIDLVLVDLQMPMMDGIEFIKMVRTAPDSPSTTVPIIVVSGFSEKSKVFAARDAGANEFLTKPVTAAALYARINAVAADRRTFVRTGRYFGPDRRRRNDGAYKGPRRRRGEEGL
jgi:CheY-like chemotaxis protein